MENRHKQGLCREYGTRSFNRTVLKDAISLLQDGEIVSNDLIPRGSNYTFLVRLIQNGPAGQISCLAVYKPRNGEIPLYDFPIGTLYKRELASYIVSCFLGWPNVPPTVIREGPHGVGSIQLFVDFQQNYNYFNLRDQLPNEFRRIALFDILANNADRKAGHCLMDSHNQLWSIDHGLNFNRTFKLRTVIWDFSGESIEMSLLKDVETLYRDLSSTNTLRQSLSQVLSSLEIEGLILRAKTLIENPIFPHPDRLARLPWPLL